MVCRQAVIVESADEEIDALITMDLQKEAVADKKFAPILEKFQSRFVPSPTDPASTIALIDYDSDFVTYEVDAKKQNLAIFPKSTIPKGGKSALMGNLRR